MAERLKDNEDLKLEALFRSEPVQDDGFSVKVISRVRRQMWVRRFSLPTAFAIGAMFAAKPFIQLAELLPKLFQIVPQGLTNLVDLPLPQDGMPQVSTIVMGVLLLAVTLLIGRMLED